MDSFHNMSADEYRFNEIFRQHYNDVVDYACFYLHDREAAKNVAQDVFTQLWERLGQVDENVFPYLIVLTKNECLNALRKRMHQLQYCKDRRRINRLSLDLHTLADSSLDEVYVQEIRELLMGVLGKSTPKTRQAFLLNRFYNKTYKEIARLQQVSVKNIEYRMTGIMRALKRDLGDY